jgi:MoaA/NifB/PqqE/SkfB family radical SAM enzyme
MLWRDGERTITDAVLEAKRVGFFHVHVYTNGTLGLDTAAEIVWVSMDGLEDTYAARKGAGFERVASAVRAGRSAGKTAIVYVIDRHTARGFEPFLRRVADERWPVLGVMFYFHTPYYGRDELFLAADERAPIIDEIQRLRRAGLPVINSAAGLRALKSGRWPRRDGTGWIVDVDGEYRCCRAADDVCPDCGYGACTEMTELRRLKPSALLGMARYL